MIRASYSLKECMTVRSVSTVRAFDHSCWLKAYKVFNNRKVFYYLEFEKAPFLAIRYATTSLQQQLR